MTGHPRRRSSDEGVTWKWIVGVGASVLLLLLSMGVGYAAQEFKETRAEISALKQGYTEVSTHIVYIKQSLQNIEQAVQERNNGRD